MREPRIFHLLHMSHRAVFRAADRVLGDRFGITAGQHALLLFLAKSDGASLGGAAAALGLRNAATSGLVDRMEGKGLIRREISTADKRACALYLAPKGADIVAASGPLIKKTNAILLDGVSPAMRAEIVDFLTKMIERADRFGPADLTETSGPDSQDKRN